jgi:hypothetical protein
MPLFSANRDFLKSLDAVPGLWNKLHYLAKLRQDESYEHWGLIKIHGVDAATDAMQAVHRVLVTETLRRTIPELVGDLSRFRQEQGEESLQLVSELVARGSLSLPPGTAQASTQHFSYVMSVVSALLKARSLSSHPGA